MSEDYGPTLRDHLTPYALVLGETGLPFVDQNALSGLEDTVRYLIQADREKFVTGPCPDCGRSAVQIVMLTDPNGGHQHTWYVCTNWPIPLGGSRCGWTGWTVPGWEG